MASKVTNRIPSCRAPVKKTIGFTVIGAAVKRDHGKVISL